MSCLHQAGVEEPGELLDLELQDVLEFPELLETLLEPVLVLESKMEVE